MSGPSTSEAPEVPADTSPIQTMIRNASTALTEMEFVQEALEHPAEPLPMNPLQLLALIERVAAATGELWWIHQQVANLAPSTPQAAPPTDRQP
jgi:hypothetical protein